MITISPCFKVQSRWERDTLASFYAILFTLRLFCAFRENLWVLLAKIAFWEDWGEEQRFEEARGIKNKAKRANGRRQGRASSRTAVRRNTTHDQPASNLARAGHAWWHDRAMCAPPGINLFRDSFFGHLSFRFFPCFSSCLGFRERLETVQKNLRLGFEFMLLDCKLWRFDDCSTFKH